MTANIKQAVVPRRRQNLSFSITPSSSGTWQTRRLQTTAAWQPSLLGRGSSPKMWPARAAQRGSITHGTLNFMFTLMALVAVAGLGFVYLHQVFNTADHNTDIQTLESRMIDLQEQQRQLELQGAELRSIETVEQRIEDLNLIATDKVSYLPASTDRVALNTDN